MTGGSEQPAPSTLALTPAWPEGAAWGTAPSLPARQLAVMRDYLDRAPRDPGATPLPK